MHLFFFMFFSHIVCYRILSRGFFIYLHIHSSIHFQIVFPFILLQNIEQSSLCHTVGPYWVSILNIIVCICQSQTVNVTTLASFSFANQKFVVRVCESVSV